MKSSLSFTSVLLLAFIVLKLCNVISWSWWWVLSPVWISLLLIVPIMILQFFLLKRRLLQEAKREDEKQSAMGYKSKWQIKLEEMRERNGRR